jgi:hypothetical protein
MWHEATPFTARSSQLIVKSFVQVPVLYSPAASTSSPLIAITGTEPPTVNAATTHVSSHR